MGATYFVIACVAVALFLAGNRVLDGARPLREPQGATDFGGLRAECRGVRFGHPGDGSDETRFGFKIHRLGNAALPSGGQRFFQEELNVGNFLAKGRQQFEPREAFQ